MVLRTVLCVACCPLLSAFGAGRAPLPSTVAPRASPLHMGSPAVVAKKAAIVEEVKATMEDAALMFCVRSEGIKVNDLNMMRQKFDESVTIRCVKNTLVKRATEDVPKFQGGESLLEYSNYWFFVPEDQMRPAVDTWSEWIKETKIVRATPCRQGASPTGCSRRRRRCPQRCLRRQMRAGGGGGGGRRRMRATGPSRRMALTHCPITRALCARRRGRVAGC